MCRTTRISSSLRCSPNFATGEEPLEIINVMFAEEECLLTGTFLKRRRASCF